MASEVLKGGVCCAAQIKDVVSTVCGHKSLVTSKKLDAYGNDEKMT